MKVRSVHVYQYTECLIIFDAWVTQFDKTLCFKSHGLCHFRCSVLCYVLKFVHLTNAYHTQIVTLILQLVSCTKGICTYHKS